MTATAFFSYDAFRRRPCLTIQGQSYRIPLEEYEVHHRSIAAIAGQILKHESTAFPKFSPYSIFSEELLFAALQSENPRLHAQGVQQLRAYRKETLEARHEGEKKWIHTYFNGQDEWNKRPFPSQEERNLDEEFFVLLDESSLEKLDDFKKKHPRFDIKKACERALWFPGHPSHELCVNLLEPATQSDLATCGSPLFSILGNLAIPPWIKDASEISAPEYFPKGQTREQAIKLEEDFYQNEQTLLEGTLQQEVSLPCRKHYMFPFEETGRETGTTVSAQYHQVKYVFVDGSVGPRTDGSVLIVNESTQRLYSISVHTDATRLLEIVRRFLRLDSGAVKALPQSAQDFTLDATFAALSSENREMRAQAVQWIKEDRSRAAHLASAGVLSQSL